MTIQPERVSTAPKTLICVDLKQAYEVGIKRSCRVFLSERAATLLNKTIEDGKERHLVAWLVSGGWLDIDTDTTKGCLGVKVVEGKESFSLLSRASADSVLYRVLMAFDPIEATFNSIGAGVKAAKKAGVPLADASVILDTKFMEAHRDDVLVFSSRNAASLIGDGKRFREGYYLNSEANTTEALATRITAITEHLETAKLAAAEARDAAAKAQERVNSLEAQLQSILDAKRSRLGKPGEALRK